MHLERISIALWFCLLSVAAMSACPRDLDAPTPPAAIDVEHLATSHVVSSEGLDRNCQADADCVLVASGEQCGACPPCPAAAIAGSAQGEFTRRVLAGACRDLPPEDTRCEACLALIARCQQGTCKALPRH